MLRKRAEEVGSRRWPVERRPEHAGSFSRRLHGAGDGHTRVDYCDEHDKDLTYYSVYRSLLYLNIFPFSPGGGLRSAACIPVPASDASTVSFSRD
jgi:hypothetical protein